MAEMIITVSLEGELVEPTRQAIEAEQHVHHIHVDAHRQIRHGGG